MGVRRFLVVKAVLFVILLWSGVCLASIPDDTSILYQSINTISPAKKSARVFENHIQVVRLRPSQNTYQELLNTSVYDEEYEQIAFIGRKSRSEIVLIGKPKPPKVVGRSQATRGYKILPTIVTQRNSKKGPDQIYALCEFDANHVLTVLENNELHLLDETGKSALIASQWMNLRTHGQIVQIQRNTDHSLVALTDKDFLITAHLNNYYGVPVVKFSHAMNLHSFPSFKNPLGLPSTTIFEVGEFRANRTYAVVQIRLGDPNSSNQDNWIQTWWSLGSMDVKHWDNIRQKPAKLVGVTRNPLQRAILFDQNGDLLESGPLYGPKASVPGAFHPQNISALVQKPISNNPKIDVLYDQENMNWLLPSKVSPSGRLTNVSAVQPKTDDGIGTFKEKLELNYNLAVSKITHLTPTKKSKWFPDKLPKTAERFKWAMVFDKSETLGEYVRKKVAVMPVHSQSAPLDLELHEAQTRFNRIIDQLGLIRDDFSFGKSEIKAIGDIDQKISIDQLAHLFTSLRAAEKDLKEIQVELSQCKVNLSPKSP